MTTSPEALREAKARVEDFAAGFECDVSTHMVAGSVAREHAADLRNLLSALQEAREALGPFVEEGLRFEPECSDEDPWGAVLKVGHFRRAAEVFRALSPGGAEQ